MLAALHSSSFFEVAGRLIPVPCPMRALRVKIALTQIFFFFLKLRALLQVPCWRAVIFGGRLGWGSIYIDRNVQTNTMHLPLFGRSCIRWLPYYGDPFYTLISLLSDHSILITLCKIEFSFSTVTEFAFRRCRKYVKALQQVTRNFTMSHEIIKVCFECILHLTEAL